MGTEHNDRLFLHAFSYDHTNFYNSRRFSRTRDICTPFLHFCYQSQLAIVFVVLEHLYS
jgi:hypothetical protein